MHPPKSPSVLTSRAAHRDACDACCEGEALRCACGSLVARHVSDGIELKCRRCKRIVIIPVSIEEGVASSSPPKGRRPQIIPPGYSRNGETRE